MPGRRSHRELHGKVGCKIRVRDPLLKLTTLVFVSWLLSYRSKAAGPGQVMQVALQQVPQWLLPGLILAIPPSKARMALERRGLAH